MSRVALLRLKQPMYIRPPNGPFTAEDTGIVVYPEGQEVIASEHTRKTIDDAGVPYDVVHECDWDEFVALMKQYASAIRAAQADADKAAAAKVEHEVETEA